MMCCLSNVNKKYAVRNFLNLIMTIMTLLTVKYNTHVA